MTFLLVFNDAASISLFTTGDSIELSVSKQVWHRMWGCHFQKLHLAMVGHAESPANQAKAQFGKVAGLRIAYE